MGLIYHIVRETAWQAAASANSYRGDTLDVEGFIHCSTRAQAADTATRYFRGESGLVLLEIDEERLASPVRYEESTGGQKFPHIYGPLNTGAVTRVLPLLPQPDGSFLFPDETGAVKG